MDKTTYLQFEIKVGWKGSKWCRAWRRSKNGKNRSWRKKETNRNRKGEVVGGVCAGRGGESKGEDRRRKSWES